MRRKQSLILAKLLRDGLRKADLLVMIFLDYIVSFDYPGTRAPARVQPAKYEQSLP